MKNEEKFFMIFLLIIILLMAFFSFQYSAGSQILPLISGIFSALIMGFLVVMSFFPKIISFYQKFETKSVLSESELNVAEKKREVSVIAWFSGCTAVIYFLGFLIGIPLFLFMFLKIWARESWILSLVLAAVVTGVVYFTFIYILRVPLHSGIFLS
jgi:hypothetical protein